MSDVFWGRAPPTPWKDGWRRVQVVGVVLLECPDCAALVQNKHESVKRHQAWHRG
jgi:hypothetical protein